MKKVVSVVLYVFRVEGLSVNLPAVLVSRGSEVSREAYHLPSSSVKDAVVLIQRAVSDPFVSYFKLRLLEISRCIPAPSVLWIAISFVYWH